MSIYPDNAADLSTSWGAGSTTNANFTVGTGADRLLVVCVQYHATTPNISGVSVSTVTYNGVALTRLSRADDSVHLGCELWYLVAPASGSHAVAITYAGTPDRLAWGAIALTGCRQSSPLVLDAAANSPGTGDETSSTMQVALGSHAYALAAVVATYSSGLDGPMNTPTPVSSNGYTGTLVTTGGVSTPNWPTRLDYGAFTPSATQQWNSNDGGGFRYLAMTADVLPAPQLVTMEPPFFCQTFDALPTIESCDYGRM